MPPPPHCARPSPQLDQLSCASLLLTFRLRLTNVPTILHLRYSYHLDMCCWTNGTGGSEPNAPTRRHSTTG
eukprot:scaffold197683_cov31-Tisochrysis_lutea.AAC.2